MLVRSLPSVSRLFPQRWRKTWAVLYPASPHGVARLEFFDHKGSSSGGGRGSSRRLDCKVIRLAECVSVAPVAVESPPEPGAAAFRLDTAQRSHLLAADAPSSAAWVQTLCQNAFPVRGPGRHWAQEARRGGSSYGGRGTGLAQTLGIAVRESQPPSCSFSLPQKGSWALAPAENPPKLSALEMLENSLYSPSWEGRWPEKPQQGRGGKKGCPRRGSRKRLRASFQVCVCVCTVCSLPPPPQSWPGPSLCIPSRIPVLGDGAED